MQVSGEFPFQATRAQVWDLLNDDAALSRCIPGCEELVRVEPDRYQIRLKVGLAAIRGTYEGTLAVTDRHEGTALTLVIEATGTGGFANVSGRLALAGEEDRARVAYDWTVTVGGPVAMVGGRVLGGVAKWIIGEFFGAMQKELTVRKAG